MAAITSPETRLVIAIDYGTTFTGVALATPSTNKAVLNDIQLITDWGTRMSNHEKIPSVISYSLPNDTSRQWGHDLSTQAIAMVHTKLQLDIGSTSSELDLALQALEGMDNLHFRHIRGSEVHPSYPVQSPDEIVRDYLARVFERLMGSISRFTEQFLRYTSVDIVVTIPVEWGYRAKNSTFKALSRAGFNGNTFKELKNMILVSEPEAAAIYTARYLSEKEDEDSFIPKLGESFVLCDAGGGTVDVISYKVKSLKPSFEIEAVGKPAGARCGAIFIDLAFKQWLKDLIGDENYQQLDEARVPAQVDSDDLRHYNLSSYDAEGERMRLLMADFDAKKKRFSRESRGIRITLPAPLDNLHMPSKGVDEGQITISYEEMECFFEPCIAPILKMINQQRWWIENDGTRLRNVFLVGGFAESPYLWTSIQEYFYYQGHNDNQECNVKLRRPNTSLTAVVRGAAIFGIEKPSSKPLSTMSACPRSYGIAVAEDFSEILHNSQDRTTDSMMRNAVARDRLKWLIKKGDLILSNQMRAVTASMNVIFDAKLPKTGLIPIYAYDSYDLPSSLIRCRKESGLSRICILEYDLSNTPKRYFQITNGTSRHPTIYTAALELNIRVCPSLVRVKLSIGGMVVATQIIPDAKLEGLDTPEL